MTKARMIELLEIEHECMLRKSHDDCDGKCEKCELCQSDDELHEKYTNVIYLLKEREPVTPIREGGEIVWWYVCSSCHTAISPNFKYCPQCERPIRWE